jgi:hypothetical protein
MQPPSAQSQAFDATCSAWLGRWVDTIPLGLHRLLSDFFVPANVCRLTVSEARLALPNFYNITVRIANVAERLAVLVPRLRDELGSSTSP